MEDTSFEYLELGQSRPSGTAAASIYQPDSKGFIDSVFVTNVGSTSASFSIYLDADGTTYDQSTALYYQQNINAGTTVELWFEKGIPITNSGNLAVQTDTANAITFSVYGRDRIN